MDKRRWYSTHEILSSERGVLGRSQKHWMSQCLFFHNDTSDRDYDSPLRENANRYVYLTAKCIIQRNLMAACERHCKWRQKNTQKWTKLEKKYSFSKFIFKIDFFFAFPNRQNILNIDTFNFTLLVTCLLVFIPTHEFSNFILRILFFISPDGSEQVAA